LQVPTMGNFGLIDKDTPKSAYTKSAYTPGKPDMELVFSDEFNVEGRTFYPGDDPYWEAYDLHYWGVSFFFDTWKKENLRKPAHLLL
jgi:beta-glucan synthesis-associated protein KRE6